MPIFYRIVASHRAATALDGEGARKMGGRWNPQGVPAAYLTDSRALAALEIMVHFGRNVAEASWTVVEVDVPDDLIDFASLRKLPAGWDDRASTTLSQQFGTRWLREGKSMAILLPSAVIPEERILMLNVQHPDFVKIKAAKPRKFLFDRRLG